LFASDGSTKDLGSPQEEPQMDDDYGTRIEKICTLIAELSREKKDAEVTQSYQKYINFLEEGTLRAPEEVLAHVIRSFGRLGDYPGAQKAFQTVLDHYGLAETETLLALAYAAGMSQPSKIRSIYRAIKARGTALEPQQVVSLMNASFHGGEYDLLGRVFSDAVAGGLVPTTSMYNLLISSKMKSLRGSGDEVEACFKELLENPFIHPDQVTYNAILKSRCERGSFEKAESLLEEMIERGIPPDPQTFVTLLHYLGKSRKLPQALKVYERAKSLKLPLSEILQSILVHAIAGKESLLIGRLLKDLSLVDQSLFRLDTFNKLLEYFVGSQQHKLAEALLQQMKASNQQPDIVSYNILLTNAISKKDEKRIGAILLEMKARKVAKNLPFYTNLLDFYGVQQANMSMVNLIRQEIQAHKLPLDSVLCVTLINLYARQGQFNVVQGVFKDYSKSSGGKMNSYVLNAMLTSFRRAKTVAPAIAMYNDFLRSGTEKPTVVTFNILIQIYGDQKALSTALEYYQKAKDMGANIGTFHAAIQAACFSGNRKAATHILQEMRNAGFQPNPGIQRLIEAHQL
jgi:pentatricopeptide repeat protein